MLKRKLKYFKVLIIICILIISFLSITPFIFASPDNTTVYVVADAYVNQVTPDGNAGDATSVYVFTKINGNVRGFLKYDLSELSSSVTITLAILRLTCSSVVDYITGVSDVQVRRVSDDSWTEMDITWTNQKAYGIVEDTQTPSIGVIEWDITDFVIAEFAGDETVSLCMRSVTEDYDGTSRYSAYRSREYNDSSAKPELYIEYTEISDNPPTYSDVGNNGITQVGESADFWCFWEDDFALDTCYFSTNSSGSWYNHTLTVSGVSSWANKTLQLNYTSSVRVNYQWFCSDNASQWSNTSIYFLITTPLYITFNFNNSTMGKFYVDYVNTANETQNSYNYNESILLDGIQLSSDYSFLNFTWIGGNSLINNYDYYTSGNNTIWCYFGLSGISGIDESYFVLGFVIAGCSILFMVIVLKGEKKEK